jgi:DNA-binding MarR family transcriptional regulator
MTPQDLERLRAAIGELARTARRLDLTLTHLHFLNVAAQPEDGAIPSEAAADLSITTSAATGVVDHLERRGLVERRTGADRRQRRFYATPAGLLVLAEFAAALPKP